MICPAQTKVSLLASAISLPASMAAMVGLIPIIPTMAVTRTSLPGSDAISRFPSIPDRTFMPSRSAILLLKSAAASSSPMTASCGLNSLICFSMRVVFLPAESAVTFSFPGFCLTTSSVWVPMEPVEPRTAIFFSDMQASDLFSKLS